MNLILESLMALIYAYLLIAICIFFMFLFNKINLKITDKKTREEVLIYNNIDRICFYLIASICWIYFIKKENENDRL